MKCTATFYQTKQFFTSTKIRQFSGTLPRYITIGMDYIKFRGPVASRYTAKHPTCFIPYNYLCCSPISPRYMVWGTSSSVGQLPVTTQSNTPHASFLPVLQSYQPQVYGMGHFKFRRPVAGSYAAKHPTRFIHYLCCSPISPRYMVWGTSSSVGQLPVATQPNTLHASFLPVLQSYQTQVYGMGHVKFCGPAAGSYTAKHPTCFVHTALLCHCAAETVHNSRLHSKCITYRIMTKITYNNNTVTT